MAVALEQTFSGTGVSTSSATFTLTVPADILAGQTVVLATYRGASSGTNGVSSISGQGAGNTWVLHAAHSCRANNHDHSLHVLHVVNQINSGTTLTVTNISNATRKLGIAAVFSGISGTTDATSGGTPGDPTIGVGYNDSLSFPSATTGTLASDYCISIGANTINSGVTCTPLGSGVEINEVSTTFGSGDRGLMMQWAQHVGTTTAKTRNTQLGGSQVWAATALTIPITVVDTTPSVDDPLGLTDDVSVDHVVAVDYTRSQADDLGLGDTDMLIEQLFAYEVESADTMGLSDAVSVAHSLENGAKGKIVVGGIQKTIAGYYVIVGGVKKDVTSVSVIVGGVKKSLA